jgi:uncharacterized membrane protein
VRRVRRFRLRHLAKTRLWLVPLTCVLAGIGLAVALLSVDRPVVGTAVTGSAASVQTILTVASTALVTLTSVVLSLTLARNGATRHLLSHVERTGGVPSAAELGRRA